MAEYMIITDSSCDLPENILKEINVEAVPLNYYIDGEEYKNSEGPSHHEIYEKLRNGAKIATAAASSGEFAEVMEKYLKEEKDVIYIGFSSALSGTYNAGRLAAEELLEKYPERKILTVDSKCASLGQGLLVYLCAARRKSGESIEAVKEYADGIKGNICHWFTVEDLFFLKRGGRISSTAATIGSMLHVKPVLHMDDDGYLKTIMKARGRKGALKTIASKICDTVIEPEKQTLCVSHGDCRSDAETLVGMISEKVKFKNVIMNFVGPVIGAHSGPGTIAVYCVGTKR